MTQEESNRGLFLSSVAGTGRTLFRVARPFLLAYLVILLLMAWFEERLIFFPTPYNTADPVWRPAGLEFEDAWFTAADGTKLHGWYAEAEDPRAVVLFSHGNAGHLAWRSEVVETLQKQLQCSVLIYDYRGYGRSEGTPNQSGVLQDARATHDWLMQKTGREADEIVLMGRSLGGGVTLDLAAERGAAAVVVESTFTSLPEVAAVHYPWLPVRSLMRTRLNNLACLESYRGPFLVSHGDADEVVPFKFGRELYEAASGEKQFYLIENGGHNDPQPPEYYHALAVFLEKHVSATK